jgi:hypothetical protein
MTPMGIPGPGSSLATAASRPGSTSLSEKLARIRRSAEEVDAFPVLEELSDAMGPRLTGSPAEHKAEQYSLAQMRKIGLRLVHLETWKRPRGWERGPATASLASPFSLPIPVAAYGWSGSTPQDDKAWPVVLLNANDVAEHLDVLVGSAGMKWKGKIRLGIEL